MGRVPDIKRLRKEDFDSEYQPMMERVAYSVNTFMEQVISVLNKNVDFNNLNQQVVSYNISLDSSGTVINAPNIKTNLKSKPAGVLCISASNVNDPNIFPISQPFVNIGIINSTTVSVQNISGLQADSTYQLTLLIIGS
ncbi:MAG: hypothetical protein COB41_00435 [Proteobacteria bacterium]|nr:MAG: hypothetical protein COB41_00435 [Pseudomonadota bacterium]